MLFLKSFLKPVVLLVYTHCKRFISMFEHFEVKQCYSLRICQILTFSILSSNWEGISNSKSKSVNVVF